MPIRTSLFADEERGAVFSSFFSCPSLFSPFLSLVLGLGFLVLVRQFGSSPVVNLDLIAVKAR